MGDASYDKVVKSTFDHIISPHHSLARSPCKELRAETCECIKAGAEQKNGGSFVLSNG